MSNNFLILFFFTLQNWRTCYCHRHQPEKTAHISWLHHSGFPMKQVWGMSPEIPYWWRSSHYPDLGINCFWLGMLLRKFASTNQKHYPDLGSDTSSVWNFCAISTDTGDGIAKCQLFSQATQTCTKCTWWHIAVADDVFSTLESDNLLMVLNTVMTWTAYLNVSIGWKSAVLFIFLG